MTIDELKRALVEVRGVCTGRQATLVYPCDGCPFNDEHCRIDNPPEFWDIDDWKEESQDEEE